MRQHTALRPDLQLPELFRYTAAAGSKVLVSRIRTGNCKA
jgi:hypothetical protein